MTRLPMIVMGAALCAAAVSGQQQWQDAAGGSLSRSAAAFDTLRQRLVVFDPAATTWELDGLQSRLRSVRSVGGPIDRTNASMVYDSLRCRTMLFGGLRNGAFLGDAWWWDGVRWEVEPASNGPSPRIGAPMCYDAQRDRIVLHQGQIVFGAGAMETWEFDGTQWTSTPVVGVPALDSMRMVYDSGRGVSVLVGRGPAGQTTVMEWNGAFWFVRTPVTVPNARRDFGLAFDPVRARTVMVGGSGATGAGDLPSAEIWEFDGIDWALAASDPRAARQAPQAWFDPSLGRVMVAGGIEKAGSFWRQRADVHSWDGANYASERGDLVPPGGVQVVFEDPASGGVGVWTAALQAASSETWVLDDDLGWREVSTTNSPAARYGAAVTTDLASAQVVLFGGARTGQVLSDTWTYDGADWAEQTVGLSPAARRDAAIAFDPVRGVATLFGGVAGSVYSIPNLRDDTWEWDGTVWSPLAPVGSPGPRSEAAMTYDVARQRTVLFGGRNGLDPARLSDTWEWDGVTWTQLTPVTDPGFLVRPDMAYDPATQQLVMVGYAASADRTETWLFDGTDWAPSQTVRLLTSQRTDVAFDVRRQRVTWFDGEVARQWTATPATVASFGMGCGTGIGELSARTLPRAGAAGFALEARTDAFSVVAFVVSGQQASTTIAPGCQLLVGNSLFAAVQFDQGRGFVVQPISLAAPVAMTLRGLPLFGQAAAFDANGVLSLSSGLRFGLGD